MDTIRGVAQGTTAKELLSNAEQRQLGVSSLYQTAVDDYTVERLISDWREKGKSSSRCPQLNHARVVKQFVKVDFQHFSSTKT